MTTFTDETFTSTTQSTEPLGYPIYANNVLINANSQEYYADGSPVFRAEANTTTTYTDEAYT